MEFGRIAHPSAMPTAAARPAKQEILVAAGESATLTLHSDTLRIFVDVVSLERGTLGQQIRVRMPQTGKIFNAQVDGRAHLEVKF
jgi:flagella basal body P-ring formation protein FlgA